MQGFHHQQPPPPLLGSAPPPAQVSPTVVTPLKLAVLPLLPSPSVSHIRSKNSQPLASLPSHILLVHLGRELPVLSKPKPPPWGLDIPPSFSGSCLYQPAPVFLLCPPCVRLQSPFPPNKWKILNPAVYPVSPANDHPLPALLCIARHLKQCLSLTITIASRLTQSWSLCEPMSIWTSLLQKCFVKKPKAFLLCEPRGPFPFASYSSFMQHLALLTPFLLETFSFGSPNTILLHLWSLLLRLFPGAPLPQTSREKPLVFYLL